MHEHNTTVAVQKRAFIISEGKAEKFQELMKVMKYLRENGYPEKFISKCENSIAKPLREASCSSEQSISIAPLYIRGVTERVKKN